MKLVYPIFFLLLILNLPFILAADTCNPAQICTVDPQVHAQLQTNFNNLQRDYLILNGTYYQLLNDYTVLNRTLSEEIDSLKSNLSQMTAERDYYKEQYENGSLGKISVRDFYMNIDKVMNNYNQTIDAKFEEVNIKINNFYFVIAIIFIFEIGLFSFALFKFKNKFEAIIQKYEQSITKLTSVKKTESHTTVHINEPKEKSKE